MSTKVDALLAAARAAEKRGAPSEALAASVHAIEAFPANPRARAALAALRNRLEPHWRARTPSAGALAELAALRASGQISAAQNLAAQLMPHFPESHALHGAVAALAEAAGDPETAFAARAQALALRPDLTETHMALGHLLETANRLEEALACFARSVVLEPADPAGHYRLARVLARLKRHAEAAAAFEQVLTRNPRHIVSWMHLSVQRRFLGALDQAVAALVTARDLAPERDDIAALLASTRALLADWSDPLPPERIASLGIGGQAVATNAMLALDTDPARMLIRARRTAAGFAPRPDLAPPPLRKQGDRIRIGYFSADFHTHATMHLMAGLFREADRARFDIHVFSYGPPAEHDPMRAALVAQCERFHDISALDDHAAVALARSQTLDLAVDLKGYTHDARTGLFARRLAPLQASYLGYPGSMGAPFIDYLVADRVVIPPSERAHYSEALVLLPHSYQCNDNQRAIAPTAGTRADHSLPASGFVFCSFNSTWKITRAEFDVWMPLLAKVPGSVLWLHEPSPLAQDNLRREAAARGVEPARLVFAGYAPQAEHLARLAHADLFLDSFVCNAHTTASDALWAGLPLLTCPGSGFPARVSASLLIAAGLPELIAPSVEAYAALALTLATEPGPLAALRQRLTGSRTGCALFDTPAHTRALEAGWSAIIERARAGLPPGDIAL